MQRLCLGDEVLVIAGSERGKRGKILAFGAGKERVFVEGLNLATKHQKSRQEKTPGQKIQKPMSIHVSKVALIDPKTAQPTRPKFITTSSGRVRQGRKSLQDIPSLIRKKAK